MDLGESTEPVPASQLSLLSIAADRGRTAAELHRANSVASVATSTGDSDDDDKGAMPVKYDRYGAPISDGSPVVARSHQAVVRKEESREVKWLRMFGAWEDFRTRRAPKLNERIRKGIPDTMRHQAWQRLLFGPKGVPTPPPDQPPFSELLKRTNKRAEHDIERDITRTFPQNVLFKERDGGKLLFNVLKAYAVLHEDVGYCQGMGFIAGLLLTYMIDEQVFQALDQLTNPNGIFRMAPLFKPGLPGLGVCVFQFDQLMREHLPRLSRHLENVGIVTTMYATNWFLTVFTYQYPFALVVRIWDVFLNEGYPFVFQVGLALLKLREDNLLRVNALEHVLPLILDYPESLLVPEKVMPLAFKFPVTWAKLDQLARAHAAAGGGLPC
eukprot:TRINITY_DN9482_c0_g1_i1.p1 TRINITY_DN9482_c0_g1~~TRINITY_DN9482_c0_g1_i1.p1  ORF type:complete len:384 (-),score=67.92 TRINITY_DN9482_c0_g1_i1:58-1209(-)